MATGRQVAIAARAPRTPVGADLGVHMPTAVPAVNAAPFPYVTWLAWGYARDVAEFEMFASMLGAVQ
jgi:hypothetical protein